MHAPQYCNCLRRGTKYSMVLGEKYGNGKKFNFLSPIYFLQVFPSQVGKNWTRGENIILFLLKLISKKLSRKEGKVNTTQHGQGKKHGHRGKNLTQRERIFFPSTPPVKIEQLIAWPKREKIKTQGEKISYIFPQLKYADTVTKKIVSSVKNMI